VSHPDKLAKAFGAFIIIMFLLHYGLGPLINTIPLFLYWTCIIVPAVSITAMTIYQVLIHKEYKKLGRE